MTDDRWSRLRSLFDRVRELPEAERAAFLDRELAGEPDLRRELHMLLADSAAASGFLADRDDPAPDSSVGPYRLLEPLGEGGFGIVYLAEQLRPIRRRVALKLVKPGMDTRQVIARFKTEQQALALMDHPGIAQVLDAGETDKGRPYFVMEYVPGAPITAFCDEEKLSIPERLRLFLQVCDAVQHAHQKGVIHRDLKPSNMLVARRDGAATVKVIDFGIVKAATGDLPYVEGTMTGPGMVLGTVGYMSPEQLGAIADPVDTRSDIYSLGVVLYELLAGDLPFGRERIRGAPWMEAVRMVLEEDPLPPSAQAARSDTAAAAERRSADSRTFLRALKGDLEWITLRALEREPDRRYSSASEFAADIRRYLANEPVLAAAPSTMYRLRKYARRHRVGVTAAAFVLLAVVGGGIAAGVEFGRAVRAETRARREAESSRQVANFLEDLFHASSPDSSKGETVTARTLLDEGTHRIEANRDLDPHVRARLLGAMADSYLNLQFLQEGVRLTRLALASSESAKPRDELEVAHQLDKLANAFSMAGERDSIPPLLDRTIAILEASPTGDPELYATCLYRKSKLLMEQGELESADSLAALAIRIAEDRPEPDPSILNRMYSSRGTIANWRYASRDAEKYYRRSLELAEQAGESMGIVSLRSRLAYAYLLLAEPEKALDEAQKGVDLARKIYAPGHPSLADALGALTQVLNEMERYDEAIPVQEEAVGIVRNSGKEGEDLAYELELLGNLYRSAGRNDLAIARTKESCTIYRERLGPDHFRTAGALADLGRCFAKAGESVRADSSFRAAVQTFERMDDKTILRPLACRDYADFCRDGGRFEAAESLYAHAEAGFDSTNEGTRPYFGDTLIRQARLRSLEGRHAEAESTMATGYRLLRGDDPVDYEGLSDAYLAWAEVRARAGDPDGAVERLRQAVQCGATSSDIGDHPELAALRSRQDYPRDISP